MDRMTTVAVRVIGLTGAVGLLIWMGGGCAKQQQLSNAQKAQIRQLLSQDCAMGDSVLPNSQIQAMGPVALSELWRAVRLGPTAAERDTIEEYGRQEHGRIQAFLGAGGLSGLTPSGLRDSMIAVTQPQYVDMQLESFVLGYQQRALNVVVDINPPELEDSLTEIISEPTLPPLIHSKIDKILNP